jgi:hypothetical protein
MLYFIVTAKPEGDAQAMISAAVAAALCALTREYGWIALIAGGIALLWRRQSRRDVAIFASAAAVLAGPWYVRNWSLTGNPFYSLHLGNLPVNPVHDGILQFYKGIFGWTHWTPAVWGSVGPILLVGAALPALGGIAAGLHVLRRHGYLFVIALLLTAVWIQSAGYTSGGVEHSMRVLSPALAVLAITAGAWAETLASRPRWIGMAVIVVLGLQVWTCLQGAVYPIPFSAGDWTRAAFHDLSPGNEFLYADRISQTIPPGSRVLSENAFLHAALSQKGIDVTPVWSPEVSFLFSSPPEESEKRLHDLGIEFVAYYPQSLNTRYLAGASPFYKALPQRSRIVAQVAGQIFFLAPNPE